jgi:predicted DCC family thiol-disulfide oxidoreductase YuxK
MWTALVVLLLTCGALALWDAPDRARRHAAERRSIVDALAELSGDGSAAAVATAIAATVARRTGQRPSDRVVLGHLAALEEDGLVAVRPRGPASEARYRLLGPVSAAAPAAPPDRAPVTVYHDGGCPLCKAEIAQYRRARGARDLRFVDVSDPDAAPADDLTRAAALARFHVRDGDGALLSGAAAFAALWRSLPGWRWLGRIVGARPVLPLAEAAYRAFLPLRPWLARTLVRAGVIGPAGPGRA